MEVHHHPHVGKKNLKEYLLEGLMIFIAVSMGFIAEGIRENITKHEKEIHLMEMLLQDLKEDTARLNFAINYDMVKVAALDTLARLSFDATEKQLSDSQYRKMYYFMRLYGLNSVSFSSTNRAFVLLDKGDAFSLIKKQTISDSILNYKEQTKNMEYQHENIYIENRNKINETSKILFDFKLIFDIKDRKNSSIILQSTKKFPLLSHDKNILQLYGSGSYQLHTILNNYVAQMRRHKISAVNLIQALEKEYGKQ